jgi:hypothetical protein
MNKILLMLFCFFIVLFLISGCEPGEKTYYMDLSLYTGQCAELTTSDPDFQHDL